MKNITFRRLAEQEYAAFREDVKKIFSIAVIETFGIAQDQDEIIPDEDIDVSLYNPQCETWAVYSDGEKVGGVVVKIDSRTQQNWLELFYIYPGKQSRGLGFRIWQSIEQKYPDTLVLRLVTPYYEKRNIHFYVNKCGFKIVEFYNKAHQDSDRPYRGIDFHDEYFLFEKVMK